MLSVLLGLIFIILVSYIIVAAFIAFFLYIAVICAIVALAAFVLYKTVGFTWTKVTGKRPDWLYSPAALIVEVALAVALLVVFFNTPFKLIEFPEDTCASITSSSGPIGVDYTISDPEIVQDAVEALTGTSLYRRITLPLMENWPHNDSDMGSYYKFYDEDGNLLKMIWFPYKSNEIGLSGKDNGYETLYLWVKEGDETDFSAFYDALERGRAVATEK